MARVLGIRANTVVAVGVRALRRCSPRPRRSCSRPRPARVSPTIGVNIVLFAFIATIVGGMGSLPGAVARRLLDRRPDGRAAGVAPARPAAVSRRVRLRGRARRAASSRPQGLLPARSALAREVARRAGLRDVPGGCARGAARRAPRAADVAASAAGARSRRCSRRASGRSLALMALTCAVALVDVRARAGLARPRRARRW